MTRLVAPLAAVLLLGAVALRAKDCSKDTYGTTPLIDLLDGTYLGHEGGLYPGATNERPAAHEAAGRALARDEVVPRDVDGEPDPDGLIGLVSIGLSNTTQEWQVFLGLLEEATDLHPNLRVVDGAKGGVGLEEAVDPADPAGYWPFVDTRLAQGGLDHDQVQAVWLKTAYGNPPPLLFPDWQQAQMTDLGRFVRLLKQRFPQLRLCYVSSRIYGHYSLNPNREEPTAYESGFGFKWLIEAQLGGLPGLNFDPDAGPVRAPWLSWGPYLWADGVNPRSDGLVWLCDDMADDGHHPGPSGRLKVAERLLEFFRTDPTTRPWFLAPRRIERRRL